MERGGEFVGWNYSYGSGFTLVHERGEQGQGAKSGAATWMLGAGRN